MSTERGRRGDARGTARRSEQRQGAGDSRRAEKRLVAPVVDPATGERAMLTLGAVALAIAAVRTSAPFDASMTWWGANAMRFVAPWLGWAPWALVAIACLPPVARPAAAALEKLGDGIARRTWVAQGGVAAAAMIVAVALPDHTGLVGDFLLRLGCVRGQFPVEIVFPQALPLDLFVHHHLPVALAKAKVIDPNYWERLLGAIEAGALVFAAAALARRLGLAGLAAATCTLLIAFSGALAMFTGYGKGFVELTLFTVCAVVCALRIVQDGRGAWPFALVLVAGVMFHRSALALFVPLLAVAVLWWRGAGARASAGRASTIAALAAPVLATLVMLPLLVASMRVTDARHLAPAGRSPGAILGAAFAPAHLADVLQLLFAYAPFVLAVPILAALLAPVLRARSREWTVLFAFALPALAILLFVHPRQGLFRDTDVFAPSLAALAVVAAALAAAAVRGAGARAWLVIPVLVVGLLSTVQTMALAIDATRGLARVRAYLEGPPRRADEVRALTWAFLAERLLGLGKPDEAVAAFERAAELAPSPRILMEWALAEEDRRNWAGAARVYRRAAERAPTFTEVWIGLANVSMNLEDWKSAREAIGSATMLEPDRREVRMLQQRYLERAPKSEQP